MDDGVLYTSIMNAAKKKEEKPSGDEEESSARPRLVLIASIIIALGIVLTAINYLQPTEPTGAVVIDLTNNTTTTLETTTTQATGDTTTTTTQPAAGELTSILKKGSQTWSKFIALSGDQISADIDMSSAVLVEPKPTTESMFVEVPFTWETTGTMITDTAESEPTDNKVSEVEMTLNNQQAGILKEVGKLLSYCVGDYTVEVSVNGQEADSCTLKGTGGPYTDSCSLNVAYDADDQVVVTLSSDKGIWLTSTDFGFVSSDTVGGKDPFVTVKRMRDLKTNLNYDSDADILYLFYK